MKAEQNCILCFKSIKFFEDCDKFVVIELLNNLQYDSSVLLFHVGCFRKVAGADILDELEKKMKIELNPYRTNSGAET